MIPRKYKKTLALLLLFVSIGRKHPLICLLILLLSGGWYGYEAKLARPGMSYMGVPVARQWQNPTTWFRVFRNEAFMLGYSDLRGNPLWVVYRVQPIKQVNDKIPRPARFDTDWRMLNRISHDDYLKSGYDRGHMAPNHVISQLYGRSAQLETFLMSNITPQRPNLNQKIWQRLEQTEWERFAQVATTLWVYTGPVFTGSTERLKSSWQVEIPDAFYKIYLRQQPNTPPRTLAFLIPQHVKGYEKLADYVTSVDHIEQLTGLDFFHELEDSLEDKLEAAIDTQGWVFQ